MSNLNKEQQEAADGFLKFLFDPTKELIISGAGGVGKTFLMGHMIDIVLPHYQQTCSILGVKPEYDSVCMTATTNKAAEVLSQATGRPSETIHSFLNLKVQDDFSTGQSKLIKTDAFFPHARKIIFIDECSMIDRQLRNIILEGTVNCKVVYVGDHCQLAPVMEKLSPIYLDNLPFYNLTQPMRNAGNQALINACSQVRATVETGVFGAIQTVPGSIDWLTDQEAEQEIARTFLAGENARILAYTNQRVIEFNNHIRELKQLPIELQEDEYVINNSMVRIGKSALSVEEEVQIVRKDDFTSLVQIDGDIELEVRRMDLKSAYSFIPNVPVPVNREHFLALIKYFQRTKNWRVYFKQKNNFPDLRPSESATVHKSQGSTYDTVFIDLTNLSTCTQPDLAARLMYVAFTRAKKRVVLFGKLASRFGSIVV